MFWALDYLCLVLVLASALLVVRLRNLNAAVLALSGVGTVLTVLFVVLGAPDDANSEVVVGAIALPTLYLIAIGKARAAINPPGEEPLGEEHGQRLEPAGEGAAGGGPTGGGPTGGGPTGGGAGRRRRA